MSKNYNPKLALSVIAKVLSDGNTFTKASSILNKDAFLSNPTASHFWRAFTFLDNQDIKITKETVINYFSQREMLENINAFGVDGIPNVDSDTRGEELVCRLEEFGNNEPSDVESLSKQLVKLYQNMRLIELQDKFSDMMKENLDPEKILSFVELESSKIFGLSPRSSGRIRNTKTALKDYVETLNKIISGEVSLFVETGLKAIDFVLGGIIKKGLIIIAGTSGDGKSTLLHNILRETSIKRNIKAGVISGEMTEFDIISRFSQMETGISVKDIKRGKIPKDKKEEFNNSIKKINDAGNIIFHEFTKMSMRELRFSMMKMSELGCEYVVIDQANNLSLDPDDGGSYLDTDIKGYLIKAWAGEFDLGVLMAHQMNKSTNSIRRKSPFDVSLADLAESGEKPADAVIFNRHDHEKSVLFHAKARDGDLTKGRRMLIDFDPITMVYSNATTLEYIPEEWEDNEE